ncbi:MAG: penicillin-binding protein 1C [Bacteroidales bacterium]|nr:penicillin-binding protein 1C [Bacteroidales bacterium]
MVALMAYAILLPRELFHDPASTVVYDRDHRLLGARIAADDQWRFPPCRTVPEKFTRALIAFEDRYFFLHPGVNPGSLLRAAWQNIQEGRIVSGGSTITMQVIRLSRKGKPRTVGEKLLEVILATRLELKYSKSSILAMYASYAPFGGNVVGLDAASWRYYGIPAEALSWAGAATLAVLPNNPALIHPGRNRELLRQKRDRLLDLLLDRGELDTLTWRLALAEELPGPPLPLPSKAPHVVDRMTATQPGTTAIITIDGYLQEHVNAIIARHSGRHGLNGIHNAAALVLSVPSGEVLAYTGNVPGKAHGNDVDVIRSIRSPGSLLKPVLFAAMLDDGAMLPGTLLPDIPTIISGYSPQNFSMTYEGAVPAFRALERSLNIPAVRMLREYQYDRFHALLTRMGITTLNRPPGHYGLSLILGGAGMTLWDICGLYAGMSRTLLYYLEYAGYAPRRNIHPPALLTDSAEIVSGPTGDPSLSAGAIYLTFEALLDVNRPEEESGWEYFTSARRIAWKTGTSFGFRDGWAVGTTPEYVVGVWVGNADGEGRTGLTGIETAAPIMFEIFGIMPPTGWFTPPYDELEKAAVCRNSGHIASPLCPEKDSILILRRGLNTAPCPYHKTVHLDKEARYRVSAGCESLADIHTEVWFILPPALEWYYKAKNPLYRELPPIRRDCQGSTEISMLGFIYPEPDSRIYIPVGIDGTPGEAVFEVAHREPGTRLYWHIDKEFTGTTRYYHRMAARPGKGDHTLRVVDEYGNQAAIRFRVESEK